MKRFQGARIVIVLIVLLLLGLAAYTVYDSTRVKSKYLAFSQAETAYETAAYKPAVQNNPVRQEVGYLLSQVLQAKMTEAQRLDDSRQGIEHLRDIEGQVDEIKTEGDKVAPLLDRLEASASAPGALRQRGDLRQIVALARRQAQIIADIRGLSYRADYYTREVFERVIDDQGVLTDEHVQDLNGLIPQLEAQFNQRENLYTELKENSDKIHAFGKQLGYEQ